MRGRFSTPKRLVAKTLPAAIIAGFFIQHTQAFANPPCRTTPEGRPCVGLVLAGGGAKGISHVGVLKVLEELHVPVDVVAGTSMGAIVGGLYALGMTADDLDREMNDMDWRGILQDRPAREQLAFRRKQDDQNFLVRYSLGIGRQGLKMPKALIHGRKLDAKLRSLTLPAALVDNFDQLPIPFRCVASDLETGEAVVLSRGELSQAMRASMALPVIFPPINIDGRVLVDGGISKNTPVDVARQLGADVLIVVDLRTPTKAEQIKSAGQVFDQMLNIMISRNTNEQLALLAPHDILIQPDVTDIGTGDFLKAKKAIERGLVAAYKQAPALQGLAVGHDAYGAHIASRGRLTGRKTAASPSGQPAFEPPVIHEIVIEAKTRVSRQVIASRMRTKAGEQLDMAKLQQDLADINGMDIFERVDASIKEQDGKHLLVVQVVEKEWGPHYLKFGLNLEDDFEGGASYNLAIQQTTNPLNRWAGELRNELQLGSKMRAFSEFYQPLDAHGRYFIAPQIEAVQDTGELFSGDQRTAELRNSRVILGSDLGRTLGKWGEVRGGLRYSAYKNSDVRIGTESTARATFADGGYFGRISVDTLDDPNIPHTGMFAESIIGFIRHEMGASQNFQAFLSAAGVARTYRRQTLVVTGEFDTVLDDKDAVDVGFPIGGFLQLSGFRRGQLGGKHRVLGRAITYYRLGKMQRMFDIPVYVGGSYEMGGVESSLSDFSWASLVNAGSVFVGFNTPVGPLYLAYGFGEGGEQAPYLFLGRTF